MQWCLVQTGAELFDLLHAYGLGILLAHACGQPIEVKETSCTYTLTGNISAPPSGSIALLDEILTLPTREEIETAEPQTPSLPVANLDGLLTALFTTLGVRVLSAADLSKKAQRDQTQVLQALKKVQRPKRWDLKIPLLGRWTFSNASCETISQTLLLTQFRQMPVENETSLWS